MALYLEHFGIREHPFKLTPTTEFFYRGGVRGEILDALLYSIQNSEGILKVSGEVGSGKTMLCRTLMENLPPGVEIVYVANPSLTGREILYNISEELGLPVDGDKAGAVRLLQDHLVEQHAQGRHVVVCIDEAQAMPDESLEEIRLLSNLETSRHKLLQIVLFGQPELDDKLARQEMRQLRERIITDFKLPPLSAADVRDYISTRLRAAGYQGAQLFSDSACKGIHKVSQGLSRRVNILADKALLSAFSRNARSVGREDFKVAAHDARFTKMRYRSKNPPTDGAKNWMRFAPWGGAVAVMLLASIAFISVGKDDNAVAANESPPLESPPLIEIAESSEIAEEIAESAPAVTPADEIAESAPAVTPAYSAADFEALSDAWTQPASEEFFGGESATPTQVFAVVDDAQIGGEITVTESVATAVESVAVVAPAPEEESPVVVSAVDEESPVIASVVDEESPVVASAVDEESPVVASAVELPDENQDNAPPLADDLTELPSAEIADDGASEFPIIGAEFAEGPQVAVAAPAIAVEIVRETVFITVVAEPEPSAEPQAADNPKWDSMPADSFLRRRLNATEAWLNSNAGGYTARIMTVNEGRAVYVERFLRDFGRFYPVRNLMVYPLRISSGEQFVITYGAFDSEIEAAGFIARLPDYFKGGRPFSQATVESRLEALSSW